jgi:hypothetical protein
VGSDGRTHVIADMDYHHLMNARRKLESTPIIGGDATAGERMREIDARNKLVAAMKTEEARRCVSYLGTIPSQPSPELARAWREMTQRGRRSAPDWTPERQAIYDATRAELIKRGFIVPDEA